MTDDTERTLGVLIRTVRYSYTERRLCCPECGRQVELVCGQLFCEGIGEMCGWSGESLAELAVRQ